jgi:serine/threonine-protein kinase
MQYPFSLSTGDTTGPGVRIATNVARRSPIVAHAEYSVSKTGTVVLATRRLGTLRGASLVKLGPPVVVTRAMEEFTGFTRPVFSPRGDFIATMAARDMSGYSMQLFDVARGVTARAPVEDAVAAVGWTATGDSLVYRVTSNDFRVRATNGSGAPTPPLVVRDWTIPTEVFSSWGPWIAFSGLRRAAQSSLDIVLAHRDSGGVTRAYAATSSQEDEPAISPDGKWLAYTSTENGRQDVWVSAFPVAAGRYLVSTSGGRSPHWSRDSRTLYFYYQSAVYAASFTPGAPPTIGTVRTIYTRDPWGYFGISSDGQTMMMMDRVREGEPQALVVNVRGAGTK